MFEPGIKYSFGILCLYGTYKFIRACEDGSMGKAYDEVKDSVVKFFSEDEALPATSANK